MRVDLHTDHEVVLAAKICGKNRDEIVGRLHRTWSWADKVTADGNVPGLTLSDLDGILGIRGWGSVMQTIGWLEVTDDGIRFPRFDIHNGTSAKSRAQDAKRKGNKRAEESENCPPFVRPATGQSLEQSKSKAEEEQNIASLQASVSSQAGAEVSSLWDALPCLLAVGMERKAAAKLASDPRACKARMEWAVPKVVAAMRSAKGCPNPAGYLRRLLTSTDGPAPPEPSGPIPFIAPPPDRNHTSNTIRASLGVKK